MPDTPSLLDMNLLAPDKFLSLDTLYGHRIIYIQGRKCPAQTCAAEEHSHFCTRCNAPASNVFSVVYDDPLIEHALDSLYRPTPWDNPNYRPILSRRWLTSEPVVMSGGVSYARDLDYTTAGRELDWLPGRGPEPGSEYSVEYDAYAEDPVSLQHVNIGAQGGSLRAEWSTVKPFAEIDQGDLVASIPFGTRAYDFKQGDLFVPVDASMTFDQIVEVDARIIKRSNHKWIHNLPEGFYLERQNDGLNARVTTPVSYDFTTQTWVLDDQAGLEAAKVNRVTITYSASPLYTVNLDAGEFRSPYRGQQAKVVLLVRADVVR